MGGGIYALDKKSRIKGTEIVWIDISVLTIPWGVPMKDGIPTKDCNVVGLHGDLKLRINNVKMFYNDIVAGKKEWNVQDLKDWIKSLLHTSLRDIFKKYTMKHILLEERERVINLVTAKVTDEFVRYGLELETFNIIGLKTSKDVQNLLEQEKETTESNIQFSTNELLDLLEQENYLQSRINDLNNEKKDLQNKLINEELTQKEFNVKVDQIETLIKESNKELKKIDEVISQN